MFEIDKIKSICERHNLWLIEDSCDALGSEFNFDNHWMKAGTIGDIGTFSFYPAHHITMGEGGAIVTNNSLLDKIMKSYRDWGRDCCCPTGQDGICQKRFSQQHGAMPFGYDHKYIYSHLGYNLKITDMQASIGLSQLEKLPKFLLKRNQNASDLLKAIDRANILSIDRENVVDLSMSESGIEISSKSSQVGSAIEKIDLYKYEGQNLRVSFNSEFVLAAVN